MEEQPVFLLSHLNMIGTELHSHMSLQGPKCYIPLESACSLFVAYCREFCIGNHKFVNGFVLPVEKKL